MHLDNEEIKTRYLKHHLGVRVAILPRDVDIAWIPSRKGKETFNKFRRYKSFIDSRKKRYDISLESLLRIFHAQKSRDIYIYIYFIDTLLKLSARIS